MIELIKKIFLIQWLWSIFAGFYLVAYTFWIPDLFEELPVVLSIFAITMISGLGLVIDGLWRAKELDEGIDMPSLPFRRLWRFIGALFLFGYLLVYIPPEGRIVAHWPLDLAITLVAGLVLLFYAVLNINKNEVSNK